MGRTKGDGGNWRWNCSIATFYEKIYVENLKTPWDLSLVIFPWSFVIAQVRNHQSQITSSD